MIIQLAHLCIFTQDLAATSKFYFETLGLKQGFEFQKEGRRFGYYVKLGGNTFIEVFQGDPGTIGNIQHLAIEVDDIDAVIEALAAQGYPVGEKKLGADGTWQVWCDDPNGVRIEFQQYTDNSLQRIGGICQADW